MNTWGRRTTGNEFFVLCPSAPVTPDWLSLPHDQQQCEAYSTFSAKLQCPENIVIPLEGVLMVSMSIMISNTSSRWTGIYQIMKKDSDFRSSWPLLYFPATKENINYTLYGPPCVKKFRNLGLVPKISQWFRKFGIVPKIRDGLDLRNNYENVVILSTFEIFSKIARNAAETLDAEHRKTDWKRLWKHPPSAFRATNYCLICS